jgi:catechol 2,3-dioxygenase-like lactoylglutathione lyase family enzyme
MRLNHVTLIVQDLARSIAFYGTLGCTTIVIERPRYARFMLPDGDATLSVEVSGEAPAESRVRIYIECLELDQVVADLEKRGLRFEQNPTDMDYLWREARLLDPDGHQVRLYYAGDNRLNPPWRLP